MTPIAHIHTDFPTKFGVPRQSGLVEELKSYIIFEPEFRNPDAIRGLDEFSYIWLLWQFSKNVRSEWSPTVRPPRLGGNTAMGVFATRSSFRPNNIGLSSVKLERVELGKCGPILHISGADLMDNTPIFDIKPYIIYTDSHPEAKSGFVDREDFKKLEVSFPSDMLNMVSADKRTALIKVLELDPRPAYQNNPDKTYGVGFANYNIRFRVTDNILIVCEVEKNTVI